MVRKTWLWTLALALAPASALALDAASRSQSLLSNLSAYEWSGLDGAAKHGRSGVDVASAGQFLQTATICASGRTVAAGKVGCDFRLGPLTVPAFTTVARIALVAPSIRTRSFGILTAISEAPRGGDFEKRLVREGMNRATRESLLGPNGALSAEALTKNPEAMGAVVVGVNDQAEMGGEGDAQISDADASHPLQTYPMSPTALADLRSRAAQFAGDQALPSGTKLAGADIPVEPRPGGRPRAFDASEGTPLDPLLNKTYDLTYAKVVPTLK